MPLQIPVLHYLIPAGVAEFPKEHSERRAFLASDFIFWDTADMEGMDTANMEDGMDAGVLQWWERDEEFEKRFRAAHSWHPRDLLRRVFGKQSAPNFNDYQAHLLAGHTVGALSVDDNASQSLLEELAREDYEQLFRYSPPPTSIVLRETFARRRAIKMLMDFLAGKYPVTQE